MTTERKPRNGLRRPVPMYWVIVSSVLSVALMAVVGVLYTGHVDRKAEQRERAADRRWCALLTLFDKSYKATPPQTPTGQEVARLMAELVRSTGC